MSMTRFVTLVLAGSLAILPFTSIASAQPTPARGGGRPARAPRNAPVVRLIDAGQMPRAPLRYRFTAGAREVMEMEMTMAISMNVNGQAAPSVPIPTIRMRAALTVSSVTPDGNARYDFRLENAEPVASANSSPQVVAMLRQQLAGLVGTTGHATVTSRGVTLESAVTPSANMDATTRQMLQNLQQSLGQVCSPFPAEPLGRGARWEVTMPIDSGSMRLTQRATYTLESQSGTTGHLAVRLTQTAPAQAMTGMAVPPGTTVRLESLSSNGTSAVDYDLTHIVPRSSLDMASDTVTRVSMGNQSQTMNTHLVLGMRLSANR